jgi:hypothetical protein
MTCQGPLGQSVSEPSAINLATDSTDAVMRECIPAEDGIFDRHPQNAWIPAFAGMTKLKSASAGALLNLLET